MLFKIVHFIGTFNKILLNLNTTFFSMYSKISFEHIHLKFQVAFKVSKTHAFKVSMISCLI